MLYFFEEENKKCMYHTLVYKFCIATHNGTQWIINCYLLSVVLLWFHFSFNTMARLFNILFMTIVTLICVDVKSICRSTRWGLVLPKRDWLPELLFLKLLMVIIPLRYWQFHRTLLLTSLHKMREGRIRITWINWYML